MRQRRQWTRFVAARSESSSSGARRPRFSGREPALATWRSVQPALAGMLRSKRGSSMALRDPGRARLRPSLHDGTAARQEARPPSVVQRQ